MYVEEEYICDLCGSVFQWERFFSSHMRHIHCRPFKERVKPVLDAVDCTVLRAYFTLICQNPSLDRIDAISRECGLDKDSVLMWFIEAGRKKTT